jgi:hypothetical protein
MTRLFPDLRPPTRLAAAIKDIPTQNAVRSVEGALEGVINRLARCELDDGVTGLSAALAALAADLDALEADVVTGVTAGTNLSGGGSSGNVTLNVVDSPSFAGNVLVGGTLGVTALSTLAALTANGASDFNAAVNMDSTLTLSPMTAGSVLFAGTGGLVSQDNAQLFWDNTNNRLGIGTAIPSNPLSVHTAGTSDIVSILNTTANQWATYIARDNGGTVRTAWGFGNSASTDTPRAGRAHWWAESGTDFVFMRGGAIPGTALGYIHNTTGNWNLGSTLGDPSSRLRVEGRLNVVHPTTGEAAVILRSSHAAGYTAADLYDSANAFKGGIGYGNASVGVTHLQSQLYCVSGGPDFQFANFTRNEVTVGMTTGSTMLQMQNGSGAAVSAANTGRIRYNTTGQKFQVSTNGTTYVDLITTASPPTVTGSRASGAALADLLTKLAARGIIVDGTTA